MEEIESHFLIHDMIKINDTIIDLSRFPDGTYNLKAPLIAENINEIVFKWFYDGEFELSALIFLKKYYDSGNYEHIRTKLEMPYVPNARMDRIKNPEEVFTLKYFAEIINDLNFDNVVILDPHSNVAPALLRHCTSLSAAPLIGSVLRDENIDVLVFPDEGSHKRYNMDEQYISFYGKKIRNWETREITGYKLCTDTDKELDYLNQKSVLIIDDIISSGGTIFNTVEKLIENGVGRILVYCTHCENTIFKGKLNSLLNSGVIDTIFTTGSIYSGEHPRIKTIGIVR